MTPWHERDLKEGLYLVCLAISYHGHGWRVSRRKHTSLQGMEPDMICLQGDVAHAVAARMSEEPLTDKEIYNYVQQGNDWLRALAVGIPPYRGRFVLVTGAEVDDEQKEVLKKNYVSVQDRQTFQQVRKQYQKSTERPEIWDLSKELKKYEKELGLEETWRDHLRAFLP